MPYACNLVNFLAGTVATTPSEEPDAFGCAEERSGPTSAPGSGSGSAAPSAKIDLAPLDANAFGSLIMELRLSCARMVGTSPAISFSLLMNLRSLSTDAIVALLSLSKVFSLISSGRSRLTWRC